MTQEAEPVLHYLKAADGKWRPSCKEHYEESFKQWCGTQDPGEATSFISGDTMGVMGTPVELRRLGIPELTARLPIIS